MTATDTSTPALRVHGLRKAYKDVVAVDGLDLEVRTGECFGLLGPNGAGKTTTIEICEGLTAPDEGIVEVLGRRWDEDEHALRERLAAGEDGVRESFADGRDWFDGEPLRALTPREPGT